MDRLKTNSLKDTAKPLIVLVILVIILSIISPRFLTSSNLLNVFRQVSINAIIAAGLTLVILTGGIDLSVGSTLAFSGTVMALMMANNINFFAALIVGLLVGGVVGFINGFLVTKGKVQPFIGTLATMMFFRGATLVLTDGRPIPISRETMSPIMNWIGRGAVLGIPIPVIMTVILFAILNYVLNNTIFGRHLYAVGGNEDAARLSGVNTERIKTLTYIICGLTAFLAGIIVVSRLASAQPTAGQGYELDAIAAVVLGGTSMSGGQGTIGGTLIGALIIGVLNNALNLMNVPSYYQQIAKAIIIIIAVLLDRKKK